MVAQINQIITDFDLNLIDESVTYENEIDEKSDEREIIEKTQFFLEKVIWKY